MPKFSAPSPNILCCENKAISIAACLLRPTRNHEEPFIEIWVNIAPDNEAAADHLVDEIYELTRKLVTLPLMGRTADHLRVGARACFLTAIIWWSIDRWSTASQCCASHTAHATSLRSKFRGRRGNRADAK